MTLDSRGPRTAIAGLVLSAATLVGIATHESYRGDAYLPTPQDVPTIGWGTTDAVKLGDKTEPTRALVRLLHDAGRFERAVKRCANVPMHQHEFDTDRNALVYLNIGSISLLSKVGTIIVIDETSIGKIYLDFISEYESNQGFSLLNYVFNNYGSDPAVVINQQNPYTDITPPVVYFNLNVASASGNPLISMVGSTMSGPYNTSMGMSFSTELYLNEFGTYSNGIYLFDKTTLSELLVSKAQDNRDGLIVVGNNEIILSNLSTTIDTITASGTYSMSFNIVDYASNAVDPNINVELTITS